MVPTILKIKSTFLTIILTMKGMNLKHTAKIVNKKIQIKMTQMIKTMLSIMSQMIKTMLSMMRTVLSISSLMNLK